MDVLNSWKITQVSKPVVAIDGTVPYLSPELLAANKVVQSKHDDQWAAGVTLFQAATGGQLPFPGDGVVEMTELRTTHYIASNGAGPLLRDRMSQDRIYISEQFEHLEIVLSKALSREQNQR